MWQFQGIGNLGGRLSSHKQKANFSVFQIFVCKTRG